MELLIKGFFAPIGIWIVIGVMYGTGRVLASCIVAALFFVVMMPDFMHFVARIMPDHHAGRYVIIAISLSALFGQNLPGIVAFGRKQVLRLRNRRK